ncbi:MAG TPA: type II toxin-antitoxin system VapC family toxin [Rhodocyclaceae bacterium]
MTLRYLLDTNVVSLLLRQPQGAVAQALAAAGEDAVCISVVVACELRFGVRKRNSAALAERVEALLALLEILPLEPGVDSHYAEIRQALEAAGQPIGPNDLLIAAHARALGLTLVTDNLREFSRVPGLAVENWAAD